jgi:hypothetical protein
LLHFISQLWNIATAAKHRGKSSQPEAAADSSLRKRACRWPAALIKAHGARLQDCLTLAMHGAASMWQA